MRRTGIVLALAAAAIGGLALAAAAAATIPHPGQFKRARFKVTVQGVQTSTWRQFHLPESRCDSTERGSGSERLTFWSVRPVVVRAVRIPGGPPFFTVGARPAVLRMRGSVRRTGTLDRLPPPAGCEVGDGGGGPGYTPPAPDCGTKRIQSFPLRLEYAALQRHRITLRSETTGTPAFKNCPLQVPGWPQALERDDAKRVPGQTLPFADLFDRKQGKMIVIGKGQASTNTRGITGKTTVEWTLTLTRLRGG